MLHMYLFQVILVLLCPLFILKIVFYDEENHRWSVPFWKKLAIFYNAPISKFWAHLVRKTCLVHLMKIYRICKLNENTFFLRTCRSDVDTSEKRMMCL